MKKDRMVCTGRAATIILAVFIGAVWMASAEAQHENRCFIDKRDQSPTNHLNGTLHISAAKGATESVDKLINAGANVNAINSHGWAPLHVAAFVGQIAIVEALLNAGANPDETPKESYESRYVLENCSGATPLHFAAYFGHQDIVDALLAAGANPNAASAIGLTPVYWADKRGHVEVVISLLEAGATHQ